MTRDSLVGRFAVSKAGHDAGVCYVIVAEDEMYLFLADGKFHTLDKPKKKSRKHVQLMKETMAEEMLMALKKKERIFDHEIKYAIKTMLRKEAGHV